MACLTQCKLFSFSAWLKFALFKNQFDCSRALSKTLLKWAPFSVFLERKFRSGFARFFIRRKNEKFFTLNVMWCDWWVYLNFFSGNLKFYKILKVSVWPGDDLINFRFLSVYILGFFFIEIPSAAYILTSKDEFVHIAVGICEVIQMTVYLLKMGNILAHRNELKELIIAIQQNFKRNYVINKIICQLSCVFSVLRTKPKPIQEFYNGVQHRSHRIVVAYFVLVLGSVFCYFYFPIFVDAIKALLGRTDLQYPLVLKANYLVFDPRHDTFTFIVYSILSRLYMNIFQYGYFIMNMFLWLLSFYVSSYLESVKLQFRYLAQEEENLSEEQVTSRLKTVIDDHVIAIKMVRLMDTVIRNCMITQFVLLTFSFCFVLFNMRYVSFSNSHCYHFIS